MLTFPPKSNDMAVVTLARLFQSFLGQINGHSSFKISFDSTGGNFKFREALADGLATFGDVEVV